MKITTFLFTLFLVTSSCHSQHKASFSPSSSQTNKKEANKEKTPKRTDYKELLLSRCKNSICRTIAKRILDYGLQINYFLFDIEKFKSPAFDFYKRYKPSPIEMRTLVHRFSCTAVSNYLAECAMPVIKKYGVGPMEFVRGCLKNTNTLGYMYSRDKIPPTYLYIWMSAHVCALKSKKGCKSFLECFANKDPSFYFAVSINRSTKGLKNFQSLPESHHYEPKMGKQ